MNTMDGTNRRSRGVPEILCNTNIYGIGKGLHPVANRASYRPAIGTWEAAVLVSRRSDRGVEIHPRRLLNRWEAAAICYWSRGTPCNAESAICVFFTRILTALHLPFKGHKGASLRTCVSD
jgi:hypothetical protein